MRSATRYRIRVGAELGPEWSGRFGAMVISPGSDGVTALIGRLPDQAALHGVLATIRDLSLPLLSLEMLETDERTDWDREESRARLV